MKNISKLAAGIFNKSVAIIAFIFLWELCARLKLLINPVFLPPFSKVMQVLFSMAANGDLWKHTIVSLRRSLMGFVLGMMIAVPLGLAIGWFKKFGNILNSLLQLFRNMPTLALLPVFVMFFGIGEFSKVMVILWGVMWSTLLNTISGVHNVDPQLIKASRSMGTSPIRLFGTVILPASMPYIFAGMRISAAVSILILIAAEMIGANSGLGYALFFYQSNFKIAEMYVYIIVMAILGSVLNFTLETVEQRSFRWRDGVA
ncbi:MAG: ABC transporter permease [Treponema sp.]|jgi:NitT/TauT family transport system permease protein|nr:ABC transporter permease [Treponema sp.]